jgi:hypothetical protein
LKRVTLFLGVALSALIATAVVYVWPIRLPLSTAHLDRTVCFGTCPFYAVDVFRNRFTGHGWVLYRGYKYVGAHGLRIGTLSRAQMAEVVHLFDDAHFCEFAANYDGEITDVPSSHTSFDGERCRHTVTNRWNAPARLNWLECRLERLVDTDRWVQPWRSAEPGEQWHPFDCDRFVTPKAVPLRRPPNGSL